MAKVLSEVRRRPRVQTVNEEESLTVQSDRNRADIKMILQRYEATGGIVSMRDVDLAYRDVSEFEDFTDMMRQTREAEAAFMRLPSKVRELFHHDVMEWLDAAHGGLSEEQTAKLTELGVIEAVKKPEPVAPIEVRVVADAPEAKP